MAVRTYFSDVKKRHCSWSFDGGMTWSELVTLDDLPDPLCQASIVRFTDQDNHDKSRVLFSNCAGTARENMTVRVSYDECKTWTVSKSLYPGPSEYSDLAVSSDMTICCMYLRGVSRPYESIRLAQFNLEWLTDGAGRLTWRLASEPRPKDDIRDTVSTVSRPAAQLQRIVTCIR